MGCYHGNHSDQSDFEVRKTPDLDLRMTKTYDGQVRGGPWSTNEVSPWLPFRPIRSGGEENTLFSVEV